MSEKQERASLEEVARFEDWLRDPKNKKRWDKAIADARKRLGKS